MTDNPSVKHPISHLKLTLLPRCYLSGGWWCHSCVIIEQADRGLTSLKLLLSA
jgi:hypothetical protein